MSDSSLSCSTMAIAYDFDETLAEENMLVQAFPELQIDMAEFYQTMRNFSRQCRGSDLLIILYLIVEQAKKMGFPLTKEALHAMGRHMIPFPGLPEYFPRINAYAAAKGITLEHYVISSNLREIIEGTPVAAYFKRIFGSGFIYDAQGCACWPAISLDYTAKTQFLFRISKGCLEEYDSSGVNARLSDAKKAIPFSNIVFIGDGETDIPSMELAREKGGHSFAVYNPGKEECVALAQQLGQDKRVDAVVPADYSEGSLLDKELKAVIDSIASRLG